MDGSWYRATIRSVERDVVSVFFVDYGTLDDVNPLNIRRNIMLESVPIQTICCSIHNIQPPGDSRENPVEWPVETLNYLHQYIVEKTCHVTVYVKSPLQVSLRLSCDVGKHLVDKKMAEYIVVKPKSRKK